MTAVLGVLGRAEQRLEQRHQGSCGGGVVVEHLGDACLAVREAGLLEVLGVGPQHGHLLPVQFGAQHQLVEPVDLGVAVPDRGDRVGETFCGGVALRPGWGFGDVGVRGHLELIDPHLQPVGPGHGERSLLENDDTHGLQHRQQLTQ